MTTTKNNEHNKLNFSSEREQSQACLNSAEHEKNQGRKVLNVPNLRFPEFQGEWEKCILGDITENFNLRNKDKIQYPMFSVTNDRGFVPQSEQFEGRDMVGEDIKAYKIIHTNDFAYNPARINVGSIAIYTGEKPCMISSLYVCFKTTKEVNNEWLMQLLKTPKMNYYYNVNGEGGVRVYLFYPNFARIRMFIPKIEEQKKIAKLLNLIDERIATQNKIIEDLKKLKSAIIEKLYSEIQGKEYSFGQLFDVVNERNKQMEYSNILSASQEKGMMNRDDLNLDIQFERSNINTYKIVRKGDYVIHLRSFQGGFAFSNKLGVCSPAYTILRPNNLLEYGYLSNYFTSQRFIKSLIFVTYGIRDGRSINVDEWLGMKTTIPSKEHQQYIVKAIGSFDRKIESEEAYATHLSKQKQYLLRQMFI